MSDGKVVVRVNLGAKADSSKAVVADAPEYQWLWHRILGAAVLVLLPFWWLWPEPVPVQQLPEPSTVQQATALTAGSVTKAQPRQPAQTEPKSKDVEHVVPAPAKANNDVAPASTEPPAIAKIQPAPAYQSAPVVPPLFSSQQGILRKVVLTADKPGPAARQLALPLALTKATELSLYTEVVGLAGQQIEHRWFYKNKLMTQVTLQVKLPYWRTWSQKKFYPAELKDWRLEIIGPEQKLLFSYHLNGR